MSAPVLEVRDLVKHYALRRSLLGRARGVVRAVEGVSFSLRAGETLAIVGESGCGKSTTARLVLQLETPDAGEIHLAGRPVSGPSMAFRRAVQMVFQDPYASLTGQFTIGAILREPFLVHRLCPRSEINGRVAGLLGAVGLRADLMSRYPHELSGGQRQRVAIARALAVEPQVIVCDEPVSALDVSIRSQIINLLLELQRERGLAFVFISHDLDLVEHISDEVAVMYRGRIVERAPTEDLFAAPRHPYTAGLLASSPVADPNVRLKAPLRGEVASVTADTAGCRFMNRCPLAVPRCGNEDPPLVPVADDHAAACLRAGEYPAGAPVVA